MLEGICAVFSQNQLITAMKLALSVISETAIDSRGDLLQVETAIHLLTKIVPIFGEAIRSDWSELVSTLLPFWFPRFPRCKRRCIDCVSWCVPRTFRCWGICVSSVPRSCRPKWTRLPLTPLKKSRFLEPLKTRRILSRGFAAFWGSFSYWRVRRAKTWIPRFWTRFSRRASSCVCCRRRKPRFWTPRTRRMPRF